MSASFFLFLSSMLVKTPCLLVFQRMFKVFKLLLYLSPKSNASCFLVARFFNASSLKIFKSTGKVWNLSTFNLLTLLFKLFKTPGTVFNSLISNSPTSEFMLAKSTSLETFLASMLVASFKSDLLHN